MNKKPLHSILMAVFGAAMAFSCAQEDTTSLDQSEIYVKYYGTDRAEVLIDMVRTPGDDPSTPEINEGGFILLSSTTETTDGSRDILLVGTDFGGNRIWQNKYTFFGGDDVPSSLKVSNDSTSIFITGTANFDSEDEAFVFVQADINDGSPQSIMKVQFNDTRASTNTLIESEPDTVKTRGADVLELDDSFIFLGSAQTGIDFRSDVNNYSILIFSLAKDTYDSSTYWNDLPLNWDDFDGSNSGDDFGVKLASDGDSYFYIAQSDDPNDGNVSKVLINSFDIVSGQPEGDAPRYGISGTNSFPKNFILNNQNIVVTGTAGSNLNERAFFLSVNKSLTDSDEDMILIDDPSPDTDDGPLDNLEGSRGEDIIRLSNGDFYIIGQFNNYLNADGVLKQNEIALIRVDDLGNVIPNGIRVLGSDGNDQGNAILLDGSEEDVVIGATMDFGGVATMLALMKTNINGELSE